MLLIHVPRVPLLLLLLQQLLLHVVLVGARVLLPHHDPVLPGRAGAQGVRGRGAPVRHDHGAWDAWGRGRSGGRCRVTRGTERRGAKYCSAAATRKNVFRAARSYM